MKHTIQVLSALFTLLCAAPFASAQQANFSVSAGAQFSYFSHPGVWSQPGGFVQGKFVKNRLQYGLQVSMTAVDNQISVNTVADVPRFYHLHNTQALLSVGYNLVPSAQRLSITPFAGISIVRRVANLPAAYVSEPDNGTIVSFEARSTRHIFGGLSTGVDMAFRITKRLEVNCRLVYHHVNFAHLTYANIIKTNDTSVSVGMGYRF
jgi:Outer membrane protein beta-barrel domain